MSRVSVGLAASVALALTALTGVAASGTTAADRGDARELRFRVLLDDKEIGFHRYEVTEQGDYRTVQSRAEFDVKFLFFNAYRYRHTLSAEWNGPCLQSLETRTNANGKKHMVNGEQTGSAFVVDRGEEVERLPSCIMNFAYWDPRILEQSRLLNPQTGEFLDVTIQELDDEVVRVDDKMVEADAYRIVAKDMRIDIWYSKSDKRWLALESLAKGERIIRYELT